MIPDGLEQWLVGKGARAPINGRTDSDGDGAPDWFEVVRSTNAFSADSPVKDGKDAKDSDGATGTNGDRGSDALENLLVAGGATKPLTSLTDTDQDGIGDFAEVFNGTNPFDVKSPRKAGKGDSDSDGISDALEEWLVARGATAPITKKTDSDSDGVPDWIESATATNPFDKAHPGAGKHLDVDADGAADWIEVLAGTDLLDKNSPVANGDKDTNDSTGPSGDGISDALEQVLVKAGATAPVKVSTDTDQDKVQDWFEVWLGFAPNDGSTPVANGSEDSIDGTGPKHDNVSDALEAALVFGGATKPVTSMTDSDSDGVPDALEVFLGHSPFDGNKPLANGSKDVIDSTGPSGDTLTDAMEKVLIDLGATAPVNHSSDTDSDGIPDWVEVQIFEKPHDAESPKPGVAPDSDGDGAPNWIEVLNAKDPFDANSPITNGGVDTNNTTGPASDGISDAYEQLLISMGATSPVSTESDKDNDGIPDYFEVVARTKLNDINDPVTSGAVDSNNSTGPGADTITDAMENVLIKGGAVAPVKLTTDTDKDGVSDMFEVVRNTNPFDDDNPVDGGDKDTNNNTGPADDGLSDGLESSLVAAGATAPVNTKTDSDSDGTPDYLEALGNSKPAVAANPSSTGTGDSDNDGVVNSLEVILKRLAAGTDATAATDLDGDGIPDWYEVASGTHSQNADKPLDKGGSSADSKDSTGPSGDGVSDALEQLLISQTAKSPVDTATDSDSDGLPDALEVKSGSMPFDVASPTTNGNKDTNNGTGPASDGITDAVEAWLIARGATGPITKTTDSDADGVADWLEVINGTDPFKNTSKPPTGSAPTASNVKITGTVRVGQVLTGSFDFADADSNGQGASRYQWLRDGDAISGATATKYSILERDQKTVLTFRVTPVSRIGIPYEGTPATQVTIAVPPLPRGGGGLGGVGKTDGTSNLRTWFTAGAGTGFVADNTEVVTWFDQSGTNNNGITVPTDRPIWQDSGANGKPLLIFGQADYCDINKPFTDDLTIISVFRTSQTSTVTGWWQVPAIVSGEVSGAANDFAFGLRSGKPLITYSDASLEASTAVNDNNWHVLTTTRVKSTGLSKIWRDGVADGSATLSANKAISVPAKIRVGVSSGNTAEGRFAGDLVELLLFNKVVSTSERRMIDCAVNACYGIAVANDLYTKDSTHAHGLAGIGQTNATDKIVSSESTDIVKVSSPSTLTDGDFLVWAHDNKAVVNSSTNVPSATWARRLERSWAYDMTVGGIAGGVGTVTIRFRVGNLGLSTNASDYGLLLDSDTDFSNASSHTTGASYDSGTDTITFTAVPLATSGGYFSLAVAPLTAQ